MDAGGAIPREGHGRYELLHRLAIGGMGEVFIARWRGTASVHRLVALKRLLPERAEQPGSVEMFVNEARIAACIPHPNIVGILDFGNERGTYYLAMELVAGQNLDRITTRSLARGRPLPRVLAVHVIAELLRGLEHAHEARNARGQPVPTVHCDISPHNVLVSYTGDVKLTDFGSARTANRSRRARTGVIRGKPSYMSPEQHTGGTVDARTDLYSTGVMLWELTLGRRLFTADNDLMIARLAVAGEIPPPRTIDPSYPPALEHVVMGALQSRPEDRIQSAAAFGSELRGWLATAGPLDATAELGRAVRALFADDAEVIEALIRQTSAAQPPTEPPPAEAEAPTEPLATPKRLPIAPGAASAPDEPLRVPMHPPTAPDAASASDEQLRARPGSPVATDRAGPPTEPLVAPPDDAASAAKLTEPPIALPGEPAIIARRAVPTRSFRVPTVPPTEASQRRRRGAFAAALVIAASAAAWQFWPTREAADTAPAVTSTTDAATTAPAITSTTDAANAAPAVNSAANASDAAPPAVASSDASAPRRPPATPPPSDDDLSSRLLPESLVRLGKRLATGCQVRGVVLPRRITFALRLDKLGRVLEASLAEPAGIGSVTAACLHTWLLRWPFRPAEREASGHLDVTVR